MAKPQTIVDRFNAANPVGTPVRFWTGARRGEGRHSKTRSEAWLMGGHTPVVSVEGHAGGVALTHIDVVPRRKYLDTKTLVDDGYLQEVNRRFFHPLGLALEVTVDDRTGEHRLSGVWDARDDPEGIAFHDPPDVAKARRVNELEAERHPVRAQALGWVIQPPGVGLGQDDG